MKKIVLVFLLVVVIGFSVYLLRDNSERLLSNYINEPYEIISISEGDVFSTYLIQVGDKKRQVVVDHESKTVREYNMLDETFRQCLDNE
ncbi:hypothetical protein EZV73_17305 [Acidaminobacter sp. JC074]|uniref:hypothetical protein n=1 Tax=Acidaminobacter sp. JC074 TaxID=2530199 RepID=UPI001F10B71E|nr:hypothetical protein [Acidaminobacter sp. JC074]MCH4889359.1 hypothetical protein [Acidaminobacter sp. JC074]